MDRRTLLATLASGAAVAATPFAHAQEYPAQLIKWVVPYPAGGGTDVIARVLAESMRQTLGQQIVVDNRPGASTNIGADLVAKSKPDGYTILSADNGTLVFNPALYKSLSYSPTKDLAPVTLMGKFPMILVVGANSGFASAKDFIAQARAKPGGINYASAGAGSPHHLAMELLKVEAKLFMVHVPYRGAAPALADVVGGQLPAMMVDLAAGSGFIKGGKVRALAVANPTRLPQLPDVPTFAELGYKNVEAAALVGVVVPSATSPEVVNTLNRQIVAAINEPSVRTRMVDFGVEPVGNTPAQYTELLKNETVRWHKLIRDLKITLD
jgi:tripartite-type tricarboxylate transporter receptor subunit TctC